ncbi:MAG: hypothetical protein NUW01_00015 [Gemmatimonadaceae bacterium]|nr:hypothetical protein [Gemmatimonadaceae bacterium]
MRTWSWTDSVAGLFIRTDDGGVFFQIQDGNYELAQFIVDACNAAEAQADEDRSHWHLTNADNATGGFYAVACHGRGCTDQYPTAEDALGNIGYQGSREKV